MADIFLKLTILWDIVVDNHCPLFGDHELDCQDSYVFIIKLFIEK